MHRIRVVALALVALTAVAALSGAASAGVTTWANFASVLPPPGIPTTYSLGGGSTVDLTLTVDNDCLVFASDLGTIGAAETGLGYDHLIDLGTVYPSGTRASVPRRSWRSFSTS